MKITAADREMAMRFPHTADQWGFAKSMSEARVNPAQLARLLALDLIKPSRVNGAAPSPTAKQGKGAFFRKTDNYIRTFKEL